jgi:glycosyltransferase involved in cell wall biosynthesis
MKEICHRIADTELILVGTMTSVEYAASLRSLIRRLGLEEKITLLLSRPFAVSKISLFQRAWVHVLPSMKEGFGLSILEAAACGTPTVGYDVPGVRDAIVQGKTGLLARPGDTSSFATQVTDLLCNAERLKSLGNQASKWAANFRWDTTAGQFLDVMKNS